MEVLVNELPSHSSFLFDYIDSSLHYRSTDLKESSWQPAFLQALEPQAGLIQPTVKSPSPCSENFSGTNSQESPPHGTISWDASQQSVVKVKKKSSASSARLSYHPYFKQSNALNKVAKRESGSYLNGPVVQASKVTEPVFSNSASMLYNNPSSKSVDLMNDAKQMPFPLEASVHSANHLVQSCSLQSFADADPCNSSSLKSTLSTNASTSDSSVVGSSESAHLDQLFDFMFDDSNTMESGNDSFRTWFAESLEVPFSSQDTLQHVYDGAHSEKASDGLKHVAGIQTERKELEVAKIQRLTNCIDSPTVESRMVVPKPSVPEGELWGRCQKIYDGLEEIFSYHQHSQETELLGEALPTVVKNQPHLIKTDSEFTYGSRNLPQPVVPDGLSPEVGSSSFSSKTEDLKKDSDDSWRQKLVSNSSFSCAGEIGNKSWDSFVPQTPGPISTKDNVETHFGKMRRPGLTSLLDSQHTGIKAESDYNEICLVHLLIAGAEAVAAQDMDLASVILVRLKELVSCSGSTMQRVAAYFTDGLQCRIEGGHMLKRATKIGPQSEVLAAFQILHEISPYIKFGHFTANQAILEAIEGEKRVHIVDFEIMEGIQWPAFMQALVLRKGGPPQLRITALCRPHAERGLAVVQETGRRLTEFASSLNLSFTFVLLKVDNEAEFSVSTLKLTKGEALVVNCMLHLPHMPHRTATSVSSFLRGMRKLSPIVLTLVEEELGCSTTAVASYFFEALHHYSAICDSLEACLSTEIVARMLVEKAFLAPRINSAVASWSRACTPLDHGPDFTTYNWCSLVRSVGFKSLPLSFHNLSQAKLLLGLYRDGFKLDERSNRLLLGWRSKPLFAASVWN